MLLNVGGTLFETRRNTLTSQNSFFSELATRDEEEVIFIDRDPTHFRHILNFAWKLYTQQQGWKSPNLYAGHFLRFRHTSR